MYDFEWFCMIECVCVSYAFVWLSNGCGWFYYVVLNDLLLFSMILYDFVCVLFDLWMICVWFVYGFCMMYANYAYYDNIMHIISILCLLLWPLFLCLLSSWLLCLLLWSYYAYSYAYYYYHIVPIIMIILCIL